MEGVVEVKPFAPFEGDMKRVYAALKRMNNGEELPATWDFIAGIARDRAAELRRRVDGVLIGEDLEFKG